MYQNIKSRVKTPDNYIGDAFGCSSGVGVRQGECLSLFLFSMYLNDIEKEFIRKGAQGRISHNVNFTYKDIMLEIVSNLKYLGIIFTPGLSHIPANRSFII